MIGLVPVRINDVWAALHASRVVEILGARPWVRIPDAPARTPGVLAWQGRAVAAFDLGLLLDAGPALQGGEPRPRTVIVRVGASILALPVDSVREVQEVHESELRAPHVIRHAHASHEIELRGVVMPVIDLASVLAAVTEVP